MLKILIIFSSFITINSYATPLKIITGHFPPYADENLPEHGLSSDIITRAFKAKKIDIQLEFNPWNRAFNLLRNGSVAGSYPMAYSHERNEYMIYSNPLHTFKLVHYVTKGTRTDSKDFLKNKVMCQPEGWEISMYKEMLKEFHVTLIRPINMESCFRMLAKKRVDFISINEMVGLDYDKTLFPVNSPLMAVHSPYLKKEYSYYFVIPRKYPDAQKLMDTFNAGLAKIKKK